MRKFVWLLLVLVMFWGCIWCLCLKREKVLPVFTEGFEPKVSVEKVRAEDITVTHEYIGHVEAIRSVLVRPYISGFIDKVLISGGANVENNQLLFVLQQDQYLAAVESAEAKVVGTTADLEKAKLYLERIQNTSAEAVSKTERDNAEAAFLAAQAALKEAKASLKIAQVNYNYTEIRAPISGVLGNVSVTKGEYVSPEGNALGYILQYDPIRVRFSMPEKDFLNLGADVHFFQSGELKLRLSNGKEINANGSVRFADNQIQSGTSSIDLFADFENKKHLLLPGAYVTVLYNEQIKNAIVINRKWVTLEPEGASVFIVKDDKIEKVPVILGDIIGSRIIITQGLNVGDFVITTPVMPMDIGKKAVLIKE